MIMRWDDGVKEVGVPLLLFFHWILDSK